MIQTLDNGFEEVRSVLVSSTNDVSVCKSLVKSDSAYYTVIRIRDRKAQTRILNIFSRHTLKSRSGDFVRLTVLSSEPVLVFKYNKENRLSYYQGLYCRSFRDRLNVARKLLTEIMSCTLPLEVQYFMLEERNLNLSSDGQVYFNYFADFQQLPERVTVEDIVGKTAEVILKLLTEGLKIRSSEVELFKVKVRRKSFSSFGAIYSDLKLISPDTETGPDLQKRIRQFYIKSKPRVIFVFKTGLLAVVMAASLYYGISEWHRRTAAVTAQNLSEVQPEYKGMEKIGTIILTEKTDSDKEKTSTGK